MEVPLNFDLCKQLLSIPHLLLQIFNHFIITELSFLR